MAEDSVYQLSAVQVMNAMKTFLRIDLFMFLCSSLAAIVNLYFFTAAHSRSKACLMFAKMYELKRIVVPGPVSCCNFFITSSLFILAICLWFFLKSLQSSGYWLSKMFSKFLAALVPILATIDFLLLLKGNQAFCDSFDVNKFCSSELFHNTDFKTFTPKYLDAYSYLDFCRVSQISLVVLCLLWISGWIIHQRRHPRRLSPL